jgi:hypothetical protein
MVTPETTPDNDYKFAIENARKEFLAITSNLPLELL